MIDQPTDRDDHEIATSSMSEPVRAPDAPLNDDEGHWLETVLNSLPERSRETREALLKALVDGPDGAGPLLGLEPATTENTAENLIQMKDSNQQPLLAPLLGTNAYQRTETLEKSSHRRSPESVCYGKLLREDGLTSSPKAQETVTYEHRGCYLAPAARWRTST
ncbi:hypothetical protein G7A66_09695 [Altererythrobacter sp. SALINAS58]|nr:hypothetical protein [Alteripontixanthobacter muriae]